MNKELDLHDFVLTMPHAHVKLNLDFLNKLLQDSSKSAKPYRNKLFANKIACPINEKKKSAMTIYGWMSGYKSIPLSKISKILEGSSFSWRDVEKNLIYIKAGIRHGEISPNFPIQIDYKLGSIVGHVLGDGSIDKRFHSLFYSNSNLDLLKEFSYFMEKLFGIKPRIWVQKRKLFEEKSQWLMKVKSFDEIPDKHPVGLFYPKICSDILYLVCGKFADGKNKMITSEIKELNLNFKKGLVRAFFDDEGSVSSKNHTIRLHQDRKDILEDFKIILKEFEIKSNPVRSYTKLNKLRYYFNINGFREYFNFYRVIGCTSKKKQNEFELLINKVKNSKQFKKKYAL
ncbi:MAG: LAGLIDADG family homing endonuclease [Candidatus Nanoarchaeia archaeon]